jgi:hypothetical protein
MGTVAGPERLRLFIGVVFALGLAAFALSFFVAPPSDPVAMATIIALAGISDVLAVRLYFEGRASVGLVGVLFAALALGPTAAALVATANAVAGGYLLNGRELKRLMVNFGQMNAGALCAWAAGEALTGRLGTSPSDMLIAGTVAGCVIFGVTSATTNTLVVLSSGKGWLGAYRAQFAWLSPYYVAMGVTGGASAVAYAGFGYPGLCVFIIPILLNRYAIKLAADRTRQNVVRLERSNQQLQQAYVRIRTISDELREAYNSTLESLVSALDVRDQETRGHSTRVATHTLDLATTLGIKDESELAMLYRGALMHDVGKLGVPDSVLLKAGALTDEEWAAMRKHPVLGFRILGQVPYLRPAARVVLAHHERWDGNGYPCGLKGEYIPVGARLFALADTFDAIVSDRPYRKGRSADEAFAEILRCAGTQFDPTVVEAFEAVFPRWLEEERDEHHLPPLYLPGWHREDTAQSRLAS